MRWKEEYKGPRRGDKRIIKRFTLFPYQVDTWSEFILFETIYIKQEFFNGPGTFIWQYGWKDMKLTTKEEYKNYKANG